MSFGYNKIKKRTREGEGTTLLKDGPPGNSVPSNRQCCTEDAGARPSYDSKRSRPNGSSPTGKTMKQSEKKKKKKKGGCSGSETIQDSGL